MSCSARLPVYTLLIGACIPDIRVAGFIKLAGITMLAMYLLGIIVALLMAWLFKKTLLKGETPMLIMELLLNKRPLLRVVLRHMWDRSKLFLRRPAPSFWGSTSFCGSGDVSQECQDDNEFKQQRAALAAGAALDSAAAASMDSQARAKQFTDQALALGRKETGEKLRNSFAGRMGRAIEPFLRRWGLTGKWELGLCPRLPRAKCSSAHVHRLQRGRL